MSHFNYLKFAYLLQSVSLALTPSSLVKMLLNEDTVLRSVNSPVVLVPYTGAHVPMYHRWMQNETLLEMTASERLSLVEEQENMETWRRDPKKLTFIILDSSQDANMAGDVNLHLLHSDSEGFADDCVLGEVEVMVAEPSSRRKGMATSALQMLMAYAKQHLGVTVFIAKILESNTSSIKLFKNSLGFREYRRIQAFSEIHFQLPADNKVSQKLVGVWEDTIVESYKAGAFSASAERYVVIDS